MLNLVRTNVLLLLWFCKGIIPKELILAWSRKKKKMLVYLSMCVLLR